MIATDLLIHDVLIIGSGPCGLAVASRLKEQTPGSLFSDSEHQRFHFLRASNQPRANSKPIRISRRPHTITERLLPGPPIPSNYLNLAVLDAEGDKWMHSWNENFEKLRISHLRSPMFFHPDPSDRDGLRAFAFVNGRMNELKEIGGVVGKELSKHQRKQKQKLGKKSKQDTTYLDERFRDDYFRPSQALFKAYCEEIAERYGISNIVEKSEVINISYDSELEIFSLKTSTGEKRSRIVILAIGSALEPSLPSDCPFCMPNGVNHIMSKNDKNFMLQHDNNQSFNSVMIIGGGLTSAQVAKVVADEGIKRIYLITRDKLKTKHFDVDLEWLAKFKNKSMSEFYNADSDQDRWEIIKSARGGGSVNPEFRSVIEKLKEQGKLVLKQYTVIKDTKWDFETSSWIVRLQGRDEKIEEVRVNQVIYATGTPVDISSLSIIEPILRTYPIPIVGGMPCLTSDLMWREDIPLFVTGKLAALRLGPAAPNLEGARLGAEFIVGKIAEMLPTMSNYSEREDHPVANGKLIDVDMRRLGLGQANQFDILSQTCQ